MKQGRGMLTDRIKEKSKELLGYEIDQKELRLMAHLQYIMVNDQKINQSHVNAEEHSILFEWSIKGFLFGDDEKIVITKKFWDAICEILFLGYVDIN